MPSAARQLAPFLSLRPLPTPSVYLVLVRMRTILVDYRITRVIPELDALVDRTIALSRRERVWARRELPHPELVQAAESLSAPLTQLDDRLQAHAEHPGIAALRAQVFPHGLHHVLDLPPQALRLALEPMLTALHSPTHQPYVQTARLCTIVAEVAEGSRRLSASADRTPEDLDDERIDIHHHLGLLFVRAFAVCWSDHPVHIRCRTRLIDAWSRARPRPNQPWSDDTEVIEPVPPTPAPPRPLSEVRGTPPPVRVMVGSACAG